MAIVADLPENLAPSPHERGLATQDRADLARRVVRAWELLHALAERADLGADTRAGRSAKELLTGVGRWPDSRWVAEVVIEARERPSAAARTDQDAEEDRLRESHRRASGAAVLRSVERAGEEAERFLGTEEDEEYGLRPVATQLGPLPLRTFLHATAYRVCVAGLDLQPALAEGGTEADDKVGELVELGFVALVDVLGALAARGGLTTSLTGVTDVGSWTFASHRGAWQVVQAQPPGPAVVGPAQVLLDITAGRAEDVGGLYRRGELRLEDVPGLLRLAPLLDEVPGIPGSGSLRVMARSLDMASRTLGLAGNAWGRLRRPFG